MTDLTRIDHAKTPRERDKALRWQASSLGVRLDLQTETRFPSGPNGERLPSYDVVTGCSVGGSLGQAENMARIVRETMQSAPKQTIEQWLAELSVMVIRKPGDEFSEALRLEAYASRLAEYPADIVHHVLLKRAWKFWPAWEELEAVCKAMSSPRKWMLAALENPKPWKPTPEPEPRITGDRAQAIMEEIGFTPKRMQQVQRSPMARTQDELDAPESKPVKWTCETNAERLRAARMNNPLMREGMTDAD